MDRYVEVEDPDLGFDDFDSEDDAAGVVLRGGGRIRPARFGIGVVRAIAEGPDPLVTVLFGNVDVRRIKLSFLSPV